ARAHAKSCRKSGDRHRRSHSRSTAGLAVAVIGPAELGAAGLGIAGLWVERPGDCSAAEDWLGPPGAHLPGRTGQRRGGWSASWCALSGRLEMEDRPWPLRFSLSRNVYAPSPAAFHRANARSPTLRYPVAPIPKAL